MPEQEFRMKVGVDHDEGVVTVEFPEPLQWVGFTPELARSIALMLESKAGELSPPDLPQGTGLFVRAEIGGAYENVEIETLSDDELRAFFADRGAEELRLWLVNVVGMIRDSKVLRK